MEVRKIPDFLQKSGIILVPLTGLEPVRSRLQRILSAIPYSYSSVR